MNGAAHCCETMARHLSMNCDRHPDPADCPDVVLQYSAKFREYGLLIHDGGSSSYLIQHCPWCGTRLPESERDRWHAELEELGFDPWSDEIPLRYRDGSWLRDNA